MKKLVFFVEQVWGVGHLKRSLLLLEGLLEDFEIDFFQGAHAIEDTLHSPRFHHYLLPPLFELQGLHSTNLREEACQLSLKRLTFLKKQLKKYDVMMWEMFPFGKWPFINELEVLHAAYKKINPAMITISSFRGCATSDLSPRKIQMIEEILDRYFDAVFLHVDPQVITLQETIPLDARLNKKLHYTGFVAEQKKGNYVKIPQILVSAGSGYQGVKLFRALLEVVEKITEYQFVFTFGKLFPKDIKLQMQQENRFPHVRFVDFLPEFQEELQKSQLSISLAGYNTLLNLYVSETAALVFTGESDQPIFAKKWEQYAGVEIIKDLSPQVLEMQIRKQLHAHPKVKMIDISGVATTRKLLLDML